ncbi:MAG: hypothetical protein KDA53_08390 [Hyphomonas sp.]|nr:hypothetical protein [Hyphomonas sp.]
MNRILIAVIFALAAPVAAADAASARDIARCKAMSASFGPKQEEVAKLKEARDTQVETVEATGDAWENAEALRNFSTAHAADADAAKLAYTDAKAELSRLELGLQARVAELNADIDAFNQSCTAKN